MAKKKYYNQDDVRKALVNVGLKRGDIAFSHSNIGYFGIPEGGGGTSNIERILLDTILEIIGPEGTFIVPTFTYSFPKAKFFDKNETPSVCGILTEIVRKHPQSYRSDDPIFSVAAIGKFAQEFTGNVSKECFGKDSFWDRFYRENGLILNMNLGVPTTYFHYVERSLNVPYRYNKAFLVKIIINGKLDIRETIYFCRDTTNYPTKPDWMGIHALAVESGLPKYADVGRGYISLTSAVKLYELIKEMLPQKPYFLTNSRNSDPPKKLFVKKKDYFIAINPHASSAVIVDSIKEIPCDIVSDGCDAIFNALARQTSLTVHEYPTGTNIFGWIIPEKWTCYKGYVETPAGMKIFSYKQNKNHIASYSKPFEGTVTREELLEHIWVNPENPEVVCPKYVYYDADWGLCCNQKMKDMLLEDKYKVVIKSDYSYGSLKIGEVTVLGEKKESVIFCARFGDYKKPFDGIRAVERCIEVFRELKKRSDLKYTYRLLLIPQNCSILAYIHENNDDIKGILLFEELDKNSHNVLATLSANGCFDRCCTEIIRSLVPCIQGDGPTIQEVFGDYVPCLANDTKLSIPMVSFSGNLEVADILNIIAGLESKL